MRDRARRRSGASPNCSAEPTSFVTRTPEASASGVFLCASGWVERLIEHTRKTGDGDAGRSGTQQRANASFAGCAAGEDVVHENNCFSAHACPPGRRDSDGAAEFAPPCPPAQPTQARCRFAAFERIDAQRSAGNLRQLLRQQSGLVVAAAPEPPPMKRHRDENAILLVPIAEPSCHELRHHRRQTEATAMLKRENQLARSFVVERGGGDPGVVRRVGQARPARRSCNDAASEWARTQDATRVARDHQRAPASRAQSRLCRHPGAAKRAARGKHKVDHRREDGRDVHDARG